MTTGLGATHILLVDDDELVLSMLRTVLERAGYLVDAAADGAEALRLFDPARHLLVITDIVMPVMEGVETITAPMRPPPRIPIIAISGGGRIGPDDYLAWVRRCGVTHTFAKPVRRQVLLDAVAELVGAPVP